MRSRRLVVGLDWDDTLVGAESQVWTPGAIELVKACVMANHHVFVHSAKANSPRGKQLIQSALDRAGLPLRIEAKPYADLYVDNAAIGFDGDWSPVYSALSQGGKRFTGHAPYGNSYASTPTS